MPLMATDVRTINTCMECCIFVTLFAVCGYGIRPYNAKIFKALGIYLFLYDEFVEGLKSLRFLSTTFGGVFTFFFMKSVTIEPILLRISTGLRRCTIDEQRYVDRISCSIFCSVFTVKSAYVIKKSFHRIAISSAVSIPTGTDILLKID